jgi:hypothetical protein
MDRIFLELLSFTCFDNYFKIGRIISFNINTQNEGKPCRKDCGNFFSIGFCWSVFAFFYGASLSEGFFVDIGNFKFKRFYNY